MNNSDIENIKNIIIEKLKILNIEKLILFGSYAYGKPTIHSDIDLYVVTSDDFMPKTFKEKNNLYLKVSRQLRDIRKIIAIDLIVHTKQMYEVFENTNSSFFKNDINKGIRLI